MRKSRKIVSMPIISIVEGVQIGSVKGLVVNPVKKEIAALIVDQKGWFREEKIIPYNKVSHVGDDAITIDQSGNVEKPTNLPEILKLLKEEIDPIGMKVISQNGKVIGYIDEYYIDEQTGQILSLEISGKFIEGLLKGKGLMEAGEILTIGADAIVVKTGTEANISKIDGGLQETFSNLKDSTSTLWNSTRQKTIEISKSIKEKTKEKVKSVTQDDPEIEITEEEAVTPDDQPGTAPDVIQTSEPAAAERELPAQAEDDASSTKTVENIEPAADSSVEEDPNEETPTDTISTENGAPEEITEDAEDKVAT